MRRIRECSLTWSPETLPGFPGTRLTNPRLELNLASVQRPARPIGSFFAFKGLFCHSWLLFARREYSLLIPSDALVGMQALEHKLGRRDLGLGGVLRSHAHPSQLLHQT